jgi:hypothetical protein
MMIAMVWLTTAVAQQLVVEMRIVRTAAQISKCACMVNAAFAPSDKAIAWGFVATCN